MELYIKKKGVCLLNSPQSDLTAHGDVLLGLSQLDKFSSELSHQFGSDATLCIQKKHFCSIIDACCKRIQNNVRDCICGKTWYIWMSALSQRIIAIVPGCRFCTISLIFSFTIKPSMKFADPLLVVP